MTSATICSSAQRRRSRTAIQGAVRRYNSSNAARSPAATSRTRCSSSGSPGAGAFLTDLTPARRRPRTCRFSLSHDPRHMSGGAYFGPAIAQRAEFLSSAWGRGTVPSAGTRQVRPGRSTASTCTRMAAVIPPSLTSILPHGRRHGTAVTHAAHRLWTAVRRCAAFLARARAPSARGSPPRHVRDCDTALVAHARTGRGPSCQHRC